MEYKPNLSSTSLYTMKRNVWRPRTQVPQCAIPAHLRDWLWRVNSITRQLKRYCPDQFSVTVLSQHYGYPLYDEANALSIQPKQIALIREVRLCCQQEQMVYARTIIPHLSFRSNLKWLNYLGNRSLGDVLFSDSTMKRKPIYVAYINSRHCLYGRMKLNQVHHCDGVWGRRSVFSLSGSPLLVSEFFLPDIKQVNIASCLELY